MELRTAMRHFLCLLWKFREGLLRGAAWPTVIGIHELPAHTRTRPWQSFGCATHIVLIVSVSCRCTVTFSLALLFIYFFGPKLMPSSLFHPHWLEFLRHDLMIWATSSRGRKEGGVCRWGGFSLDQTPLINYAASCH